MTEPEVIRLIIEALGLSAGIVAIFKWGFSKLATKDDLAKARRDTQNDIKEVKTDVKEVKEDTAEIRVLAKETNGQANHNSNRLTHIEGFLQTMNYEPFRKVEVPDDNG